MKIEDFFPPCSLDDCPQEKEHHHLIPYQKEFCMAPEKYLALIGGYGCLAATSEIAGIPIADWTGGYIQTLQGLEISSRSYLKGQAGLYRVSTRRGNQVVATLAHRFLTPLGWRSLGSLAVGDMIGANVSEDAVRLMKKRSGSLGRYFGDIHQHGEQLRRASTLDPDIRLLPYQPSISDLYTSYHLSKTYSPQVKSSLPPWGVAVPQSRSMHVELPHLIHSKSLRSSWQLVPLDMEAQWLPRGLRSESYGGNWVSFLHDQYTVVSSYPPTDTISCWDQIEDVQFEGIGDFYDLAVLPDHHYLASGLWHHNSGKSIAAVALGTMLSLKVSGNHGIVVRRSYAKLHDTVLGMYLTNLDRLKINYEAYEVRDHWPHRLILENGSEILFRETKDLGRFLGPEYGWFQIEEAIEEPRKTFNDLVGRLRLQRAKKYLKGFLTTNPPNSPPQAKHWIEDLFGKETGVKPIRLGEESTNFRLWRMATTVNPFLPKQYVQDLMLTHSPSEVRRILHGEYTTSFDGKQVYPMFEFTRHVGDPPIHHVSLVRVWDFGYHVPCCTWHQFIRCKAGQIHWHILHELIGRDIEAVSFARLVLSETEKKFPEHPRMMIVDGGDTAGAQVSDKGPGPIIILARYPFGLQFRHRKFPDIMVGVDLIRNVLRSRCKCGHYTLLVHRDCRSTIEMFAGGYHYAPLKLGKEEKPKPNKDGYYDNVADTIRYAGELFYRPASRDPGFMSDLIRPHMTPIELNEHDQEEMLGWLRGWPKENRERDKVTSVTQPTDGGSFYGG